MTTKHPHPHAELIAEWIKDTGRTVQYKLNDCWHDVATPCWHSDQEYRFKPDQPEEPKITSSLTDDELNKTFYYHGFPGDPLIGELRRVADAAAKRAIEDLKIPDNHWINNVGEPLPEGVWDRNGQYYAECCRCGRDSEILCDISEIDLSGYRHYCGGSQFCIP